MTVDTECRETPAAPAVRRPLLARGHLLDMGYLLVYALVVVAIDGLDWLVHLGNQRIARSAR